MRCLPERLTRLDWLGGFVACALLPTQMKALLEGGIGRVGDDYASAGPIGA